MKEPTIKTYTITRIIKEMYEVSATSKQNAKTKIEDPFDVEVIKEIIKEQKP